jgi:hypothetical protein
MLAHIFKKYEDNVSALYADFYTNPQAKMFKVLDSFNRAIN